MLAAQLWGNKDVRVEEIPDPGPPEAGWVRVRVDACGICGTDVEEYTDGPIIVPSEPHVRSARCVPLTLGHEVVGVVDSTGADVTLETGQKVALEANIQCGECLWCRRGQYQLCETLVSIGLHTDGGLADYVLAPASMCVPYADGTSPLAAVLAEPLAVAVRALRRGGMVMDATVGIVGAGTVGLLATQVARVAGARMVVSVDPLASRRDLATALGADAAVIPDDAEQVGKDLTGGVGMDLVIEAAGNPKACRSAIELVRRGGRTVLLGVFDAVVEIPMLDFLLGEKDVVASLSHTYDADFTTAVSMIDRGLIQTEPLVTDCIRLPDVVQQGFDMLTTQPSEHLKVVVTPAGSEDGKGSASDATASG